MASLCRSNVSPEVSQAVVGAKQGAEDRGICEKYIARTISIRRHPEKHIELGISRFRERMRLRHVDRLSGQDTDRPGVVGRQRIVWQMHMKVEGCDSLKPAFRIQVSRDGQRCQL